MTAALHAENLACPVLRGVLEIHQPLTCVLGGRTEARELTLYVTESARAWASMAVARCKVIDDRLGSRDIQTSPAECLLLLRVISSYVAIYLC